MSRALRAGTPADVADVIRAIDHLAKARDYLKRVGARRTVAKVRSAIKSAGGAMRHVKRTLPDAKAPL